jgi:branched-chain amino acid transport system substrate-binding protein
MRRIAAYFKHLCSRIPRLRGAAAVGAAGLPGPAYRRAAVRKIAPAGVIFLLVLSAACAKSASNSAPPKAAPAQITIGTLYAGSGNFATSSQSQYAGLQAWAQQVNASGGAEVAAYHKKIPVKIVAYNDQSSTTTAATLYDQLITQNHVNLLVADFGSVLTSVAVPIAQEHHMVLFDVTGTGASFFTPGNPYLVLTSLPTSAVWPDTFAKYLLDRHIARIAVLYDSNDFTESQATTLRSQLAKGGVTPVYYNAVPTETTSYGTLLHTIAAKSPDAVIEFGYSTNDIPFLQAVPANGLHFKMVFTVFPGQLFSLILKNVGPAALAYTYTYPTPPLVKYNAVTYGPGIDAFTRQFQAATGSAPNFLNVAGYNAGLIIQDTLAHAKSLDQLALRQAAGSLSGGLTTLDGPFAIDSTGAQTGEPLPVAQLIPSGSTPKIVVVYPPSVATGSAVYPAP